MPIQPGGSPNLAVEVEELGRIYKIRGSKQERKIRKELVALQGVNLQVKQGELFGLLGPNGAGKTTLIKILTTLLAPSSGRARVADHDVVKEPGKVRALINMVSGGESSGYGLLTVRENLWMFSQFYGMPSRQANERIRALLKIVGLEDRMDTKSSDLSTGLRQKMNIVRASSPIRRCSSSMSRPWAWTLGPPGTRAASSATGWTRTEPAPSC